MEIVGLLLLGILIVISPGADFVLVVKNSLANGRRAGLLTACGISTAIGIHVGYSMLGVGYLISQNEVLFSLVKYAGAGYLFYLGITALFTRTSVMLEKGHTTDLSGAAYWRQGFFCNLFNPKTMLFFISLFSQIITAEGSSPVLAVLYGGYLALLHCLWFGLVAYALSSPAFEGYVNQWKQQIQQLCGVGLMGLSVALVLKS
ncbi:LysE family translocator [Photobacterium profundum]|uniref:Threonine efflux protein n=1 Tax=Photobacterium profundum (strain SS9) TaxID=298386 RepID=Q6LG41_PHOPR|nr:LysE family transporter [Photobacterium profundum]CAG23739.1 conserved hypothetical protein [Photobacterium profundum SS9]